MENLWPDQILTINNETEMLDWHTLLASQGNYLETITLGLIHAGVELQGIDSGLYQIISLWPRGQKQMQYELLRLRSQNGSFPAMIETYHMGEEHRYKKVSSLIDIKMVLKNIFQDERTLRIIRLLAAEAIDDVNDNSITLESPLQKTENSTDRTIAIGAIINEGTERIYSQVSIFGVAGFISADVIRGLVKQPDSQGGLIKKLNDRFVVTLDFMEPVKMTLSVTELKQLQAQAKKVLIDAL